jgi:hypothetical protein
MAQAAPAVVKILTKSPQLARGKPGRGPTAICADHGRAQATSQLKPRQAEHGPRRSQMDAAGATAATLVPTAVPIDDRGGGGQVVAGATVNRRDHSPGNGDIGPWPAIGHQAYRRSWL